MKLFKRKRDTPARVQLRSGQRHPFGVLDDYVPLGGGDVRLYRSIREALPVIDAAVVKLIRLVGGFTVECSDKKVQAQLEEFLRRVDCGRGQRGVNAFLDCYLDSLLTCGRAVGEIVPTSALDGVDALICGSVDDIQVREGDNPMDFELCRWEGGQMKPLPYQDLLLFTPLNPEAENPYGVSMLRSMPFLSDVLMKIYHTLGVNWERAGNVRYSVVYKPGNDMLDRSQASARAQAIADQWQAAMQQTKSGCVNDFVAVGDVEIKVIGADGQILDSETPVRQILEQLVSRTGLPPFLLGLSWSTTERMSSQQADLMTSELYAIRRSVTPVLEKICDMWMRLTGCISAYEIVWDEINLQDEVEEAKAALYRVQAEVNAE